MSQPVRRHIAGRQPALEWVAVALGALTFVWGFLDWWGAGGGGLNGYRLLDGYLPIGFALVASLLTVVNLRPDRTERTAWLAIGTSGLAVLFTIVAMAVKPTFVALLEGLSTLDQHGGVQLSIQIGLILMLVSVVLQLACMVAGWLFATGRVAIGGPPPSPAPPPAAPPPAPVAPPPVASAEPPPPPTPPPAAPPPVDNPFA